jgi:hypothetical protein
MHYIQTYQEPEKLEKMEIRLRQEIADLELSVEDIEIMCSLKHMLGVVYSKQGR